MADPPLRVDGVPFDLQSYPYLWELYDDNESKDVTIMKGSQMGFTLLQVLRTIDRAERLYPRGILYLFPTRDDVTDFSKTRFSRFMEENPIWGRKIHGTDSANVKQVGHAFVYFRGAKSRTQLKSIPVDSVVYDEFDEMLEGMIALARQRMQGSKFQHEFKLSTPTYPETRIHWEYLKSDQRVWMMQCPGCNVWQDVQATFPDCLQWSLSKYDVDIAKLVCTKCGADLKRATKCEWVAGFPKRQRRGYSIAQLVSPTINLSEILEEWKDPKTVLSEFYNHRLGLPYADIQQSLTDAAILACCKRDAPRHASDGPCWAGADIGKKHIYVTVGTRTAERHFKALNFFEVEGFDQVHDLSKSFNVQCGVMDAGAETRSVKDFIAKEPNWWGALYNQSIGHDATWDYKERMVQMNRTDSLDHSHKVIVDGRIEFPRPSTEFREKVMPQLKNLVRVVQEDERTGEKKALWIRKGVKNDDFRHSFNLGALAATQITIEKAIRSLRRSITRAETSFMAS